MPETLTMPAYEERVEVRIGGQLGAYYVHFDVAKKGTTLVDHDHASMDVNEVPNLTIREVYHAEPVGDIDILPTLSAEDRKAVEDAVDAWVEGNVEGDDLDFFDLLDEFTGADL